MKYVITIVCTVVVTIALFQFFTKASSIVRSSKLPSYGKFHMVVLSKPQDGTIRLGSVCDEGIFALDGSGSGDVQLNSVVVVDLNGRSANGYPVVSIRK